MNTTSGTPMGVYPFKITVSDGTVSSQVTATLGVGDYSVSIGARDKNRPAEWHGLL